MKKSVLLIALLFAFSISAQTVSLTKSEIFKDSKKNSSLVFSLEDDNGGLITIRSFIGGFIPKLKGYYIQHFDAKLKLIKEVEYEVDNNFIQNAFIKDGQLHIIELLSTSYSTSLINFKYFGIGIFPFFINNFSQMDGNHMGEVIMSKNNTFFAINFDFNNKDKETHKIFVFNTNFESVYDKLIEKDIKDKLFEYNSIDVDDKDGTVYFLGKAFENNSRKSKKKGEANYHFELLKVNAEGQKTTAFKKADKFISSMELIKTEDRLSCVGFYGVKDQGNYNGVCLFNLNPDTLAMETEKFTPFSNEFMTDKYGNKENRKKRKQKKGIKNIDFKGIFTMDNGDIIVNAEEFFITTHTSMNGSGGMSTYTIYHFNDIISVRLDKDGGLKWARNINKAQTGLTNSSYTSIPVDETTYFFINCSDNIKKLSADRIAFKQTKAKKSNLYMISIDKNGAFDFEKLIDDKDSKVYYKVNDGVVNLNDRTVILPGKKKKNTRILKIKF